MKEVQRIVPMPPPKNPVPFKDQRFGREEQCFDFNDRDNVDLFFKPSPRKESRSIQRYREQVEVDIQGAGEDSDGADVMEGTRLFLLFNHLIFSNLTFHHRSSSRERGDRTVTSNP